MTKTTDQILPEVTAIFRNVLNNDSIVLKYETSGPDVPEWDSLSHIELVVAVEKHFKIRFNFGELQKFKNVGEMCDSIASKLSSGGTQ
jgi:acyl carrier protein